MNKQGRFFGFTFGACIVVAALVGTSCGSDSPGSEEATDGLAALDAADGAGVLQGDSVGDNDNPEAYSSTLLTWSAKNWKVKTGKGLAPGPNNWAAGNAYVDTTKDELHLKITKGTDGQWYCAEVESVDKFSFGMYQFKVIGPIDNKMDKNIVFGMFNYPPLGPDKTNEIDIEFARWGNASNSPGNYTIWPTTLSLLAKRPKKAFPFTLGGTGPYYTTHRFIWKSNLVSFQSLYGHTDTNSNQIVAWSPTTFAGLIPQNPQPIHINLWLYNCCAADSGCQSECKTGQTTGVPSNGQGFEIIVKSFKYVP
jgi:hypothetical protein